MKKMPKILLAVSGLSFLVSLTDAGSEFLGGILKPLAAILFGAFLICEVLKEEISQYDEEFRLRMERAKENAPPDSPTRTPQSVREHADEPHSTLDARRNLAA